MGRQNFLKKWGVRMGIIFLAALWLALVGGTWSEAAEREPAAAAESAITSDDSYDFNWLDPEKKIYVLQNRKYLKSQKVMFSLMGGLGLSNSYRNSWNVDPRIAYYFNESWGIEGFYTFTSNYDNNTYTALTGTNSQTLPWVRQVTSQAGAMLHWVPWYAKINVFNSILYFDWYFSAGVGQVNTQVDQRTKVSDPHQFVNQGFTGFFVGTGHQYHLSQMWSVRVDVTGSYISAPFNPNGDKSWFPNYNLGIGVALSI